MAGPGDNWVIAGAQAVVAVLGRRLGAGLTSLGYGKSMAGSRSGPSADDHRACAHLTDLTSVAR
jgi:hypothetical protein